MGFLRATAGLELVLLLVLSLTLRDTASFHYFSRALTRRGSVPGDRFQPSPSVKLCAAAPGPNSDPDNDLTEPVQALPSDLAAQVINSNFKGTKKQNRKNKKNKKGKKGAASADRGSDTTVVSTAPQVQAMPGDIAARLINGNFKVKALEAEVVAKDKQLASTAEVLRSTLQHQHAKSQALEAQVETAETALAASKASVAALTKNYGDLMVSSHEAKLRAVGTATAPLKEELTSLSAALEAKEASANAFMEEVRASMVSLAMQHQAREGELNAALAEGKAREAAMLDRVAELETTLENYMVQTHESKLKAAEVEEARRRSEEKEREDEAAKARTATEEEEKKKNKKKQQQQQQEKEDNKTKEQGQEEQNPSLQELQQIRQELMQLQAERDEYIREREEEMAALGDGMPPH